MTRYAAGEAAAFDELFRRYEARAYRFFLQRTRSSDAARDLYQELFLRLHRFRDRFRSERRFSPWFFRIAERVFLDELRRRRAHEVSAADGFEPAVQAEAERKASQRELLRRVLTSLSAEQAQIVVGSGLAGWSYAELAQRTNRSTAAVKQIASRALRRLRAAHAVGV